MKEEGENKSQIGHFSRKQQEPLFQCVLEEEPPIWKTLTAAAFWKQFFTAIFNRSGNVGFIPSIFANPEELAAARARGRTQRMEAGLVSVFLHAAFILMIYFIARGISSAPAINPD